jgi:ferrochelatase
MVVTPNHLSNSLSNPGLTGVLIVNLGTPDSTSVPDVRKYLRQFLMDPRVIDVSYASRLLLVNGVIAPFRAPKSARLYKKVWMKDGGSPLKYYGLKVERRLQQVLGNAYAVKLAMRYQNPGIPAVLAEMQKLALRKLIVIPLFPQYASASTGSVSEEVMRHLAAWPIVPDVEITGRFFERPDFIQAFAHVARPVLAGKDYELLLFSYHGLPERQILKGDNQGVCTLGACCDTYTQQNQWCYRAQCFQTTRLICQALGWPLEQTATTFQSRLGRTPWIKPYTDEVLPELAKKGIKRIAAMSPSFIADCLETTLEIGEEYRDLFLKQGGEALDLIPSLNDSPEWVDVLAAMVRSES